MTISYEQSSGGIFIVHVKGRLDQELNPRLEATLNELQASGHYLIVVDLSETTYINSGGLRCLVSAWRQAKQQGGNVVLCGLSPRLLEIFTLVGFDKVFQIFPTRRAAQNSLQK